MDHLAHALADHVAQAPARHLALVDEETAPMLEAARPEVAAAIRQLAATLVANSDDLAGLILADAA